MSLSGSGSIWMRLVNLISFCVVKFAIDATSIRRLSFWPPYGGYEPEVILPSCRIVGYREELGGRLTGPHFIQWCSSLAEAKSVCPARLWFERDSWCAIAICSEDWIEIVRYRRFPPGRQVVEEDASELVWGQIAWRRNSMGARLSTGASGRRVKSFGGNSNERSGFEGI